MFSVVEFGVGRRGHRKMTGVAMGMLKTGMDEEMVRAQLIQAYVQQFLVKQKPIAQQLCKRKHVALFGAVRQMKRRRQGIWVDVNGRLVDGSCCGRISSHQGLDGRAPSLPVTDYRRGCKRE